MMLCTYHSQARVNDHDLQLGGLAGNLKMTMPTAFTTAMLAWGLVSFGPGYAEDPGTVLEVQQQVVWGADYLLKTVLPNGPGFDLIYQVKALYHPCWDIKCSIPVSC